MSKKHKQRFRDKTPSLSPARAQRRLSDGDLAWHANDRPQAVRLWRQASSGEARLQAVPRLRRALLEQGREAAAAGRWRKAREFLDEAAALAEDDGDEVLRCLALSLALEGQSEKALAAWKSEPADASQETQRVFQEFCRQAAPGRAEAGEDAADGSSPPGPALDCSRAWRAYRRHRTSAAVRTAVQRDPTPGALQALQAASAELRLQLSGCAASLTRLLNASVERLASESAAAVRQHAGQSPTASGPGLQAALAAWTAETDSSLQMELARCREFQRLAAARSESLVSAYSRALSGDAGAGPGAQLALAVAALLDGAPEQAFARVDGALPTMPDVALGTALALRELSRVRAAAGRPEREGPDPGLGLNGAAMELPRVESGTRDDAHDPAGLEPPLWLVQPGGLGPGLVRELLPSQVARWQARPAEPFSSQWLRWLEILDELAASRPQSSPPAAREHPVGTRPSDWLDTARWVLAGEALRAGDCKLAQAFANFPGLAADCPDKLRLRIACLQVEDGSADRWSTWVVDPARELSKRLPGPAGDAACACLAEGLLQSGFRSLARGESETGARVLEEALGMSDPAVRRRAAELLLVQPKLPGSSIRRVCAVLDGERDDARSAGLLAWASLRSGAPAVQIERLCRELLSRHAGDFDLAVALAQALIRCSDDPATSSGRRLWSEYIKFPREFGVRPDWVLALSALDALDADLSDTEPVEALALRALQSYGTDPDAALTAIGVLFSWDGLEVEAAREWDRWVEQFGADPERFLDAVRLAAYSGALGVIERRMSWARKRLRFSDFELSLQVARAAGAGAGPAPLSPAFVQHLSTGAQTAEQLERAAVALLSSGGEPSIRRLVAGNPGPARALPSTSWLRQFMTGQMEALTPVKR